MTEDQRALIDSDEVRQLLDNRHLKNAFASVAAYLEEQALDCDTNDAKRAQHIVACKQLLWKVKRELERTIEDGDMARLRIEETEKRSWIRQFRR
jgi:hypothetical protein